MQSIRIECLDFEKVDRRGDWKDVDPDVDIFFDPLVLHRVEILVHDDGPRITAQKDVIGGNDHGDLEEKSLYGACRSGAVGAVDIRRAGWNRGVPPYVIDTPQDGLYRKPQHDAVKGTTPSLQGPPKYIQAAHERQRTGESLDHAQRHFLRLGVYIDIAGGRVAAIILL